MGDNDTKGDNAGGGLTDALFDAIVSQLTGGGAKGTPAERAALFLELAREEHFATHAGSGTTSVADAMFKYLAIARAVEDLTNANTPATQSQAITDLGQALHALGKQWTDFGPVGLDFSQSVKS